MKEHVATILVLIIVLNIHSAHPLLHRIRRHHHACCCLYIIVLLLLLVMLLLPCCRAVITILLPGVPNTTSLLRPVDSVSAGSSAAAIGSTEAVTTALTIVVPSFPRLCIVHRVRRRHPRQRPPHL